MNSPWELAMQSGEALASSPAERLLHVSRRTRPCGCSPARRSWLTTRFHQFTTALQPTRFIGHPRGLHHIVERIGPDSHWDGVPRLRAQWPSLPGIVRRGKRTQPDHFPILWLQGLELATTPAATVTPTSVTSTSTAPTTKTGSGARPAGGCVQLRNLRCSTCSTRARGRLG